MAIGDIDETLATRTASELGAGVVGLPLDVTDRRSFAHFLDQVDGLLGAVDVLVNNAGIMPISHLLNEPDAMTDRIVAVNVLGVINGTKLALERMAPRGSGHIVNVASQAGRAGFGGLATYCASKYAVVGFSAALADELQGSGISISCVMPAAVDTDLAAGLPAPRLIRTVGPEQVAGAVIRVLERPRLNVHVPRAAAMITLFGLLPRWPRRLVERVFGGERIALSADPAARLGYEQRLRDGI